MQVIGWYPYEIIKCWKFLSTSWAGPCKDLPRPCKYLAKNFTPSGAAIHYQSEKFVRT